MDDEMRELVEKEWPWLSRAKDQEMQGRLRRAPFSVQAVSAIVVTMGSSVEYLFADAFAIADEAARKQGWRPHGRAEWNKPDGTVVYFICFAEQLAIVPAGGTVHVVGKALSELRRRKRTCRLVALAA